MDFILYGAAIIYGFYKIIILTAEEVRPLRNIERFDR